MQVVLQLISNRGYTQPQSVVRYHTIDAYPYCQTIEITQIKGEVFFWPR